jgi:AcrR family transcriptional regulator
MRLDLKNSATEERITLAAAQLFSRQGYHGTSTREIARLADVSENTLFRHFDHKEDLFWSALRAHSSGLKLRRDVQEGIAKCDSPEVVLPKVFELLADTLSFRPELPRLIAVAFLELNWKADSFCHEHLSPFLLTISKYLESSIKSGKLRDLDPQMVTAALMMTSLMHPGISRLIDSSALRFSDSREAGRAYAKFWLEMLSPRGTAFHRGTAPSPERPAV